MIPVNRQGEVWVFAEQEDAALHDVALELCGKARELADRLGVKMGAVLVGWNARELSYRLIQHGADNVYLVEARLEHYQTQPTRADLLADREAQAADRASARPRAGATWRRAGLRRCAAD
jgi:electron transfer flavoprotein alpha subunit